MRKSLKPFPREEVIKIGPDPKQRVDREKERKRKLRERRALRRVLLRERRAIRAEFHPEAEPALEPELEEEGEVEDLPDDGDVYVEFEESLQQRKRRLAEEKEEKRLEEIVGQESRRIAHEAEEIIPTTHKTNINWRKHSIIMMVIIFVTVVLFVGTYTFGFIFAWILKNKIDALTNTKSSFIEKFKVSLFSWVYVIMWYVQRGKSF